MRNLTLLLSYVVPVKSKVKISQNFVTGSEYMNFKTTQCSVKTQLIAKVFKCNFVNKFGFVKCTIYLILIYLLPTPLRLKQSLGIWNSCRWIFVIIFLKFSINRAEFSRIIAFGFVKTCINMFKSVWNCLNLSLSFQSPKLSVFSVLFYSAI